MSKGSASFPQLLHSFMGNFFYDYLKSIVQPAQNWHRLNDLLFAAPPF
jgi:hypothetical protein